MVVSNGVLDWIITRAPEASLFRRKTNKMSTNIDKTRENRIIVINLINVKMGRSQHSTFFDFDHLLLLFSKRI